MRHTRAHRDNRRAHHALTGAGLTVCPNCGAKVLQHRVCENCGQYKGRVVVDMHAGLAKKEAKKKARTAEAEKTEAK